MFEKTKLGVTKALSIPEETILGIPYITLTGSNQMLIENYKGIVEYDSGIIRLLTNIGIVKIIGKELYLKHLTHENIIVNGEIFSIEFLK